MATARRTPKAAASNNDFEQRISSVLSATVAALERSDSAGRAGALPRFFPNGIEHIAITLSYAGAEASITVSGVPRVPSLDLTPRARRMPESCREMLLLADDLTLGQKVPNKAEVDVSGAIKKKITRADPEFKTLVENTNAKIVFKDEEGTGADKMMSKGLRDKLAALADLVAKEWNGVKLRVTEAWDEDNEHAGQSLHYEGRAADLTTSPVDDSKLGRLGRLAVNAGLDWVWYENEAHIHVSVKA